MADVISALLSIARIHPIGRMAGLILPLVLNGFEQIKGIVDDRNGQVDFEAAIAEAHRQMEQAGRQQAIAREMKLRPAPVTPRGVYRPVRRNGRVQGVLRRDDKDET